MSRWKTGDTQPHMIIDCFDADGSRPNLTEASLVQLRVWKQGALVVDRDVKAYASASGTVDIPLQASDVAAPGSFNAKIFVQWPDGSRQHYPPADKYMAYTVTR